MPPHRLGFGAGDRCPQFRLALRLIPTHHCTMSNADVGQSGVVNPPSYWGGTTPNIEAALECVAAGGHRFAYAVSVRGPRRQLICLVCRCRRPLGASPTDEWDPAIK